MRQPTLMNVKQQMKYRVLTILCLIVAFACKKDSPPEPPSIQLGKRDYTWTRDTLFYLGNAQTTMQSIYGTSGNNVYIVGHCEVSRGRMYHFDGTTWQPVNVSSIRGGFNAIGGSGASNIFVVGAISSVEPITNRLIDSCLVVQFAGATWTKLQATASGSLWCVSVVSPSSVWTGGSEGIILRLNGSTWETYRLGSEFFISSITALSHNEAYCMGHVEDYALPIDSSGSFLFRFDGTQWLRIDSVMRTPGAPPARFGLGVYSWNGVMYTIGPNIYQRQNGVWSKLVNAEVGHMSQSAVNNIFAVANTAWHYNGANWKHLDELGRVFGFDCYADGKEVFIVGNDNLRTYVVHGK
jgi:hypothetical protein